MGFAQAAGTPPAPAAAATTQECHPMAMTIVTRSLLKDGAEEEWDAATRERLEGLQAQPDEVSWSEVPYDAPPA
jgi:hypothetical protein